MGEKWQTIQHEEQRIIDNQKMEKNIYPMVGRIIAWHCCKTSKSITCYQINTATPDINVAIN